MVLELRGEKKSVTKKDGCQILSFPPLIQALNWHHMKGMPNVQL